MYRAALVAARAAASLACTLGVRRAVVRENLKIAFGAADGKLVRAIYRHFAEAAADLVCFRRLFDPERFDEHFSVEGGALEHFRETKPKAGVFVSGHFGNWELFGAALRHLGIPVAPVARPLDSGWLARRVHGFRVDEGQEIIDKDNALPLALKALRRGTSVAFLLDQSAGRHGVPIPFFGRPAWTFAAPAALALKLDLPIYVGYSTRLGDGIRYRCWAEHLHPDGDVETVTARINAMLEGFVRAHPEQWWWFHRRWKPPRADRRGKRVSPAGLPIK